MNERVRLEVKRAPEEQRVEGLRSKRNRTLEETLELILLRQERIERMLLQRDTRRQG